MSPDDVIRLRHMAEAAESALRFCQGRARADLDTDDMPRFALTRAVEIIGEAANKVSIEARTQNPGIAWPAIVGMRNRSYTRTSTWIAKSCGQPSASGFLLCCAS
jgi:uncharacterized protein with HEPN domain